MSSAGSTSLSSSSRRSSSSSSYRSSARYSASTSYRSEGSAGGSADSLEPLFEPFMDRAGGLFGEEGSAGPLCLSPFTPYGRPSYAHSGPSGGAVAGCQSRVGSVCSSGDSYYMSADVSHFQPHDVVVLAYNHYVVIHAEKVLDDGSVSDTFTHKSLLPEDMDPLSVSGNFGADGVLVVSVRRNGAPGAGGQRPCWGVLDS